ncbi:hypothetical protein CSOJ01_11683 [Colletotrichum sojae]|uniref:Uncharacterized protein n=1 Tax=Colletotrichum sojae TaxID=2175907 RepID=A0A8H6MMK0_9PEZI|nr:hypothetical protein CSOJ01_11683 [Colletotrichum sojae]
MRAGALPTGNGKDTLLSDSFAFLVGVYLSKYIAHRRSSAVGLHPYRTCTNITFGRRRGTIPVGFMGVGGPHRLAALVGGPGVAEFLITCIRPVQPAASTNAKYPVILSTLRPWPSVPPSGLYGVLAAVGHMGGRARDVIVSEEALGAVAANR